MTMEHTHTAGAFAQQENKALKAFPLTMMVKPLPRKYLAADLEAVIHSVVGPYACNLIYVPWDDNKHGNSGYAFVNFEDETEAQRAFVVLRIELIRISPDPSTPMTLTPAKISGIRESILMCTRPGKQGQKKSGQLLIYYEGRRITKETAVRLYCCGPPMTPPKPSSSCSTPPPGLEHPGVDMSMEHPTQTPCRPQLMNNARVPPQVQAAENFYLMPKKDLYMDTGDAGHAAPMSWPRADLHPAAMSRPSLHSHLSAQMGVDDAYTPKRQQLLFQSTQGPQKDVSLRDILKNFKAPRLPQEDFRSEVSLTF